MAKKKAGRDAPEEAVHLQLADPATEVSDATVRVIWEYVQSLLLNPNGLRGKKGGLVLRAMDASGMRAGDAIAEYGLDSAMSTEDLTELAETIAGCAHAEAEGMGEGTWGFSLYALRDGINAPFARRRFLIYVENAQGSPLLEPNAAQNAQAGGTVAFIGQNQRHIEALMRQNAALVASCTSSMHSLVGTLSARLEVTEKTHFEALALIKEALEAKDERQVRMMREQQKIDRNTAIVKKFLQLAPLAAGMAAKHFGLTSEDPEQIAAALAAMDEGAPP